MGGKAQTLAGTRALQSPPQRSPSGLQETPLGTTLQGPHAFFLPLGPIFHFSDTSQDKGPPPAPDPTVSPPPPTDRPLVSLHKHPMCKVSFQTRSKGPRASLMDGYGCRVWSWECEHQDWIPSAVGLQPAKELVRHVTNEEI